MRLLLFPGAHKTGTTLLQRMLEANRGLLEQSGYWLINRRDYYSSEFCSRLKSISHRQKTRITTSVARKSLSNICEGNVDRCLILSIENLFGEFSSTPRMYHAVKPILQELRALLPEHQIDVSYYIRRQDTFFESIYIQFIHKLKFMPFSQFLEQHFEDDLRWSPILNEIQEIVGSGHLTVQPFEQIDNGAEQYVSDMFRRISPDLPRKVNMEMLPPRCTNSSLSAKGIELALTTSHLLNRKEQLVFMRFLKTQFSIATHPRACLLSDSQRSNLIKRFSKDNEELAREFLPDSAIMRLYFQSTT